MSKISEQFRSGAGEFKRKIEKTFAGFTCIVRRIDMEEWMASGAAPQGLVEAVIRIMKPGQSLALENVSGDIAAKMTSVKQSLICYAVCDPKIVTGDTEPDADSIHYVEIPMAAREEIYSWIMRGSSGIPIETEGGETTLEAVTNFHNESGLPASVRVGDDV